MKNLVTAIVVFLCLSGFLRLPIAGAADTCIEADDSGYLDIGYVDQVETSWCWVASANAVTNHFGLLDPSNSNAPYTKCRLYNIAKSPYVDCCTNTSDQACQKSGFPWEVFNRLEPKINYLGEWNPMTWLQIKAQICPNWSPGHPFIFIAEPHTGGLLPHTHVVKGFDHDDQGFSQLLVDDHSGYGARYIDYECKYKLPANCQAPSTQWDRYGDIYDIQPRISPPHDLKDLILRPLPSLFDPGPR